LPRLILILLLLAGVVFLVNRFRRLTPEMQKKILKTLVISGLVILLGVLVLTGRLNWLIAAVGALLPLLPRAARLLLGFWPSILPYFRRYQQNRQASMNARFVKLQIDMLSGELQGEVLQGDFKGQKLQQMTMQQLIDLLDECKQQDADSAALIESYLDRMHPGWLGDKAGSHQYTAADSDMNEQQARDILGVAKDASKDDVIKAHKRLMQKLHPDRGGSDYLAKQINLAKDTLLKLF